IRLYGSARCDLVTQDVVCDWVDLSEQGTKTQTVTFSQADEIHRFFNRAQPAVRLAVDAPLSLSAYAALTHRYACLAAVLEEAVSPTIRVNQRNTKLTFLGTKDSDLFAIAYFATLPFTAGRTLQRHLVMLTAMLQTYDSERLGMPYRRRLDSFSHYLAQLCQRFPHQPDLPEPAESFLTQPLQLCLTNSRGQTLDLYRSTSFGLRQLSDLDSTSSQSFALPAVEELGPQLSLERLIEFLTGIQDWP
ncbi:MAG: hypothetical protein F6J97_20360, partial [Leptolyngbya sp. SIO4C1]|nr:hypothetical protein [Leptolyngbya sp. SIO4C1]